MSNRAEQINELLQTFPNDQELTIIDPTELFSLMLPASAKTGGQVCSLLIDLPADFPAVAPILLIEPVIGHEWVQPSGQINRPWRAGESSLAQLLMEIRREFGGGGGRASVGLFSQVDNDSLTRLAERSFSVDNSVSTASAAMNSLRTMSLPTSPVQSKLREEDLFLIDQMEAAELNLLLKDEQAFESFISSLVSFAGDDASLAGLEAQNYALAEDNLGERVVIERLMRELKAKHSEYQEALKTYRDLMTNSGVSENLTLDSIVSKSKEQLKEADLNTQTMLKEALITGKIDASIKDYIKQRRDYHYRSILLQKLSK